MGEDYFRYRDQFAQAIDPRLYSIAHLDDLVATGRAQCWFSDNACIVTELRFYPTGARVIHGLVAAGDLQEIVETLIPRAEAWARAARCVLAIIESRAGWQRELKDSGYEPFQVSLAKEL